MPEEIGVHIMRFLHGRIQVWSKISAASHDIETVLVNGRSLRELSML